MTVTTHPTHRECHLGGRGGPSPAVSGCLHQVKVSGVALAGGTVPQGEAVTASHPGVQPKIMLPVVGSAFVQLPAPGPNSSKDLPPQWDVSPRILGPAKSAAEVGEAQTLKELGLQAAGGQGLPWANRRWAITPHWACPAGSHCPCHLCPAGHGGLGPLHPLLYCSGRT